MGAELLALLDRMHKTVALLYAMQVREQEARVGALAELEAIMGRIDHLADLARNLS